MQVAIPKRKRDEDWAPTSAQRKAYLANKKFAGLYPWGTHGAVRLERGTDYNLRNFGTTYKEATDEQKANRRKSGYTGRGKYWGRALGSALGGIGGMMLGGPKGAAIGGSLGGSLGDKLTGRGLYEGRGSYAVTNSLMSGSSSKPPMFKSISDETGALVVSHREYIADIFGNETTESFKNRSYSINPGLERTFPWLSQIAQNYEEYEMVQCVFEFRSTVAVDVSSNGQVGTIVMVTNYNAGNRPFTDKNTMMQYDGAMSCKTTQSMIHGVECDPSKISGPAGNYIRANPVVSGQDVKTYDHGLFQLASIGLPDAYANDNIGELWISYTVKLRKPRLFSGKGLNVSRDQYLCTGPTGSTNIFANMTPYLGTAVSNNIGTIVNFVSTKPGDSSISLYDLVFPASYSGNLEIKVTANGTLNMSVNKSSWRKCFANDDAVAGTFEFNSGTTGNFAKRYDIYGALPDSQSAGEWYCSAVDDPNSTADNDQAMILLHVKVSIATDGVDNKLRFQLPMEGVAGDQLSIEVAEYNTFDISLTDTADFVYQGTKLPYPVVSRS
jgi:hypothetical protein